MSVTPSTPTAEDVLHGEALRLAAAVRTLILDFGDRIEERDARSIGSEVAAIPDLMKGARRAVTPEVRRQHFDAARTAALRTMVALERLAARSRVPLLRAGALHRRLSSVASGLAALSEPAP